MRNIFKIIKEEYVKFLYEAYDEDSYYEQFDREDNLEHEIFYDFLNNNTEDFTKHIPWTVIPFNRLKKIWEDYMQTGVVRDTRGLENIKDIMIDNTTKIGILTKLAGHTEWGGDEAFDDNIGYWIDQQLNCLYPNKPQDLNQLEIPFNNPKQGYVRKEPNEENNECTTQIHPFVQQMFDNYDNISRDKFRPILYKEMADRFFDYYMDDPNHKMGGFISDYGLKPLLTLLGELVTSKRAEDDVPIIDKMLNVIHQRSDIANWFVEGGSRALSQLSGYTDDEGDSKISGPYHMGDYR